MRRDDRLSTLRARQDYARLVEQAYGWPARKVYGQGRVWRRHARQSSGLSYGSDALCWFNCLWWWVLACYLLLVLGSNAGWPWYVAAPVSLVGGSLLVGMGVALVLVARTHGQWRAWRRLRVADEPATLFGPWACRHCGRKHLHHVGRCRGCGQVRNLESDSPSLVTHPDNTWLDRCGMLVMVLLVLSPLYLVARFHWALGLWPFTPSVPEEHTPAALPPCDAWLAGMTTERHDGTWYCTPQQTWKRASEWETQIAHGLRLWPCPHGHVFGGEDKGCVRLPKERVTSTSPPMVAPRTQPLRTPHATQPEIDTQGETWTDKTVNLPLLAASRPGDEPSASYEGSPGQEALVFDAQVQECVVWRLDSRHRVKPRALTLHFTMEVATAGTAAMSVALNGYAPHPAEAPVPPTLGMVQKMVISLPTDGLGLRPAHVPVTRVQLCRHITADTAVGALAVHRVCLEP